MDRVNEMLANEKVYGDICSSFAASFPGYNIIIPGALKKMVFKLFTRLLSVLILLVSFTHRN